jgi:hypothetical protein
MRYRSCSVKCGRSPAKRTLDATQARYATCMAGSGHPLASGHTDEQRAFRNRIARAISNCLKMSPQIFQTTPSHASHLHSCKTLTAPVFSVIWLRTESHQTPVGIKLVAMPCDRPWRQLPPQRNFGARPCPGGVCIPCGYRHDDDASPLMAHGLGDSAFCIRSDGARAASKSFEWFHTSPLSWLAAPGQTVTRNTGAHRRASGLAACGSTPARACVPEP